MNSLECFINSLGKFPEEKENLIKIILGDKNCMKLRRRFGIFSLYKFEVN